jgi:hypothetical protein
MIRSFLGLLGLLTALFPERIIEVYETVAIENPEECDVQPGIRPGIRAEGALVTLASLTDGRAYAWMMNLTGAFGAVVLAFPHLYRDIDTALVYDDPDAVEWNDRFTDGVRTLGLVYVLMAVKAYKNRLASR